MAISSAERITRSAYSVAQPETPSYTHVLRCWPEVDKYSPCEASCPLHMDVPNYVMAIAQGNINRALSVIRETNPLPSVCGRVCHHPCEDDCNRKVIDSPIAIMWLKRYAAEHARSEKPSPIASTKQSRVAIVGSGPAGLTAAYDLVRKGYPVTVFEASSMPGGVLTSAIPDFLLPLEAVLADISYMRDLGVRIHTNVRVGRDVDLAGLQRQFKAVIIATGTSKSATLRVPGADLPGISPALPFLRAAKMGQAPLLAGKVWIIGGGGVAMDVARTALRLKAQEVHVACLESRADMPAFEWDIEMAEKEGVRMHPSLAPQQFISRNGVKVGGISFKRVASTTLDSDGRIHWTLMEGTGSDYAVDADAVIIAIGQAPDIGDMLDGTLNLARTGCLQINKGTLQTNVPGIFAAGDISATGATITQAMAAGRKAALSVDQFLSGVPVVEVVDSRESITIKPEQVPPFFARKARWEMPRLMPRESVRGFREGDLGYTHWQAVEEATRCLNCRMCANCVFERGQVCFETANRLL